MLQEARIPILRLGNFFVASPQVALHDKAALQFKEDVLQSILETHVKGLVLDVSGVDVVDSFLIRQISEISASARMIGATVIVTGLRPEVVMSLVEMGFSPKGFNIARSLDAGVEKLKKEAIDKE